MKMKMKMKMKTKTETKTTPYEQIGCWHKKIIALDIRYSLGTSHLQL
jgi:hypothetical protein